MLIGVGEGNDIYIFLKIISIFADESLTKDCEGREIKIRRND